MKKRWKGFQIRSKIILSYITILILSFLLTFRIISLVNQKYTETEVRNAGIQTVNALARNLSFIFDNVTQFSNYIYFDDTIQNALENIDSDNIDPFIQRNITKSLVNIILSGDYISSVFIFDKYLNKYNSYKIGPILVDNAKITNTEWYKQMKQANGNGFFIQNSEDVLSFPTRADKKYISYIREIRNKETYEPLATLLVTIEAETIQSYFETVSAAYDSQFFIVDSKGNYIIESNQKEAFADSKIVTVSQDLNIQDWKLVGVFAINTIEALAPYYTTTIILIMSLNIIFVFICSLLLTKLIFAPLAKIEKHMMLVEKGQFIEMPIEGKKEDEISSLKKVFNHMVNAIKNLIQKVKEEEQIIAKGELDLLQAQINPHFLYNTLDAVSALALMEDHKNCFKMTQALGSFYRNSLNSGMDFISIKDEIECIKSYMTILNIRYDNSIFIEYDLEDNVQEYYILKLLLQPLIENAVHHGIKENGGEGKISIKAYQDEDEIIFIVTDDGCGMEEERVKDILDGKTKTGQSGFGIYSLIQRIQLYYQIQNPITIHSEIGSGTEITIRLHIRSRSDVN